MPSLCSIRMVSTLCLPPIATIPWELTSTGQNGVPKAVMFIILRVNMVLPAAGHHNVLQAACGRDGCGLQPHADISEGLVFASSRAQKAWESDTMSAYRSRS